MMAHRKMIANWLKWFGTCNFVVFYLLSSVYLFHLPAPLDSTGVFFLATAFWGQIGLLLLLLLLPIAIILLLLPSRFLILMLSIILLSFGVIVLFVDTFIFSTYSFHINLLLMKVIFTFGAQEFFGLSFLQAIVSYTIAALIIIFEICAAYFFWKRRESLTFKFPFSILIIIVLVSMMASQIFYAYAYAVGAQSVLQNSRVLPGYVGTQANGFILKHHIMSEKQIVTAFDIPKAGPVSTLNYPLHPIISDPTMPLPNIIVIGIDTWRADTFTPETTPNIDRFSKKASIFYNHFSGGDATLPGLYTLFYSIPSLYWNATNTPPVIFQELAKYHYQENVFFSAGLEYPPFYKNIFLNVPNLQIHILGDEPYQRDEKITEDALNVIQNASKNKNPFFMFVFYDSVHSSSLPPSAPQPFQPIHLASDPEGLHNDTNPIPYFNFYKNTLIYDDKLVGEILDQLEKSNLLDNTIVIITSDHGQEFNDNHKDYWGHVSNFTQYQTKVPLIVYIPTRLPHAIYTKTSHYDVMPTLLQEIFKVSNPIADYSIGSNLFTSTGWTYLPVGSYNFEGLIAPPYIYNFYPLGVTAVYDMHANLQKSFPVNNEALRAYFQDSRAYYK